MRNPLLIMPAFIAIIIVAISLNSCAGSPNPTRGDYLYPEISISKDDKNIVFAYRKNTPAAICIAKSDGTDVKQLTYPQNEDHIKPKYSPDGSQILFISFPLDSDKPSGRINLMNVDGTNIRQLPSVEGSISEAIFSPDGKKIYFINSAVYKHYSPFVPRASHGFDIYSMTVDGKDIKRLTNKNEYSMSDLCVFSDGKTLLFHQEIDKVHAKDEEGHTIPIYAFHFLSLDSNEITYLRPSGDFVSTFEYALSPDDKTVVFQARVGSGRDMSFELFSMDMKTRETRQLTKLGGTAKRPIFFNNSEKLLFLHDVNWEAWSPGRVDKPEENLMQVNIDGSDLKKIVLRGITRE